MSLMLAVITLFAMLIVEDAGADQAISPPGNTQPPDASSHYWTGRIEQDTTWRDTVYVGGDVTIASGATLTLAPNTQVRFLPHRDDTQGGLDPTRAELIVEGRLHAYSGGIVFCSANAASSGADWYGIVVERGSIADVSNATIRDGLHCLDAETGGRVTMDHVAFANCRGGNFFGKLAVGVLGGAMIGMVMGSAGESGCGGMGDDPFCGTGTFVAGVLGMVAGAIIGLVWASNSPDRAETPNTSDEARQISVGIVPNTKGRLSAVATLRF